MLNFIEYLIAHTQTFVLKTGEQELVFSGHADFVKTIKTYRNWLFTGSSDKTIIQWDLIT